MLAQVVGVPAVELLEPVEADMEGPLLEPAVEGKGADVRLVGDDGGLHVKVPGPPEGWVALLEQVEIFPS